ncbi:MAG: GNAT family N-acetyltransferase, partial [Planctomycetes bacterium]|nr:GNAT family N-acetyltransferase [Planctomycetota bacterium]
WQAKGMGSLLLDYMVQIGRQRGVKRFVARVLPANKAMLAVFYNSGYRIQSEYDGEAYTVAFDLAPPAGRKE